MVDLKFRPQRFGTYMLVLAVLLAFVFLLAANYNFVHHASSSLQLTKDNYGQASVQQIANLLEQQFSLLKSVVPTLVDTYFPEDTIAHLEDNLPSSKRLFDSQAENMLSSLKAINSQVTAILFFSSTRTDAYGELQTFYGVTANDVGQHWDISLDSEITTIFPGVTTYSQNAKLLGLNKCPLLIVPLNAGTDQISYFCIVLSENYFNSLLDKRTDLAVMSYDSFILHNNTQFANEEVADLFQQANTLPGSVSYISMSAVSDTLTVLHVYDSHVLKTQLNEVSTRVLLLDCLLLFVSIVLARIFEKRITMPFRIAAEAVSSYPAKKPTFETKRHRFSRMSFREQIFSYFIAIILPAFLVFSISSIYFYRTITTSNYRNTIQVSFDETYDDVQQLFDNTEAVAKAISLENDVQQLNIGTQINWCPENMRFFENRINVGIFNRKGYALYLSDSYSFSEKHLLEEDMITVQNWAVKKANNEDWLQFTIPYRSTDDLALIGYLVCRIEPSALVDTYVDLYNTSGEAFITDAAGKIVSHKHTSVQNSAATEISQLSARDNLFFSKRISGTPYFFVLCGNFSQLQENQRAFLLNTLYLCYGVLVVVLLLSAALSHIISKYVENVCRQFYAYDLDEPELIITELSLIDEVNQINKAFNEMIARIEQMNDAAIDAAKQKLQFELDARRGELALLQAQINPHFLSNTFENINYFIRNGEPDKAINTLNTLSDMFSYAVREKRKTVPLADEINYVKRYVEIMQVRFPNVFSVNFDIAERFLHCAVPCFFLQPIVENAITHALLPKGKEGLLDISCMETADCIYLVIKDNGVGMDQEKLHTLSEQLMTKQESSSIGLYNTHHVLRQMFGVPYGLNISSQKGIGTTIIITLPNNSQYGLG